jgi:hypothetical protein
MKDRRFGKTFEQWQEELDSDLTFMFGLDSEMMPDWCWWDLWDCGLTAAEAVQDYVENQGFFA